MEEDYKPAVQHQRWVNPKIHDIIKKEVEKLLDAGLIYLIFDSPWVSPVHCVLKKGGFTVVENVENELIPTRLVTEWRVCIDYRKLNEATRKDHFPLPFMDQMLERLAGNEYYCFLDGFSGELRNELKYVQSRVKMNEISCLKVRHMKHKIWELEAIPHRPKSIYLRRSQTTIKIITFYASVVRGKACFTITCKLVFSLFFIPFEKYTLEILHKHGMDKGQSIGTPMATKPKLDADLSGNPVDQTDYRSKIRSLMHLTSSRPDIVQAVYLCARYQSRPTKTPQRDADHARCIDSRKSTSGGIQFLGGKLVSWMLKKQNCTAMSLAEAEHVALSASCAQVMWTRTQL
nr:reverse transcriptase domain-containing protein [Tanacetum cinerariifolium]GEY32283.1 reverse transcriptase domain-containing protein [Tanacetum cinerariifolium]